MDKILFKESKNRERERERERERPVLPSDIKRIWQG
jgi:hypothetical protein